MTLNNAIQLPQVASTWMKVTSAGVLHFDHRPPHTLLNTPATSDTISKLHVTPSHPQTSEYTSRPTSGEISREHCLTILPVRWRPPRLMPVNDRKHLSGSISRHHDVAGMQIRVREDNG